MKKSRNCPLKHFVNKSVLKVILRFSSFLSHILKLTYPLLRLILLIILLVFKLIMSPFLEAAYLLNTGCL